MEGRWWDYGIDISRRKEISLGEQTMGFGAVGKWGVTEVLKSEQHDAEEYDGNFPQWRINEIRDLYPCGYRGKKKQRSFFVEAMESGNEFLVVSMNLFRISFDVKLGF